MTASCSQLPLSGPDDNVIVNAAVTAAVRDPRSVAYQYALVDLDACVVSHVYDIDGGSLFKTFGAGKGPAPAIAVGPGDILQVTVFESKSGGLFIPADSGTRPGNFVTLPPMLVDNNGFISVPYGGEIRAAGKSIQQLQREIEERLADRAIEPKVVVSLTEQNASVVAVLGEVNTPRKARLTQNGERVLDMIAQAGGPHAPGYETYVTIQRRGRKATIYFNNLVSHPEENIFVTPGDTIYVYREPR
jgi:polysaccharide export outer membrane protein